MSSYFADFNTGAILVNCTHPKQLALLGNWHEVARGEGQSESDSNPSSDDQAALGLVFRNPFFAPHIIWDALHLGLYSRTLKHFAGKFKRDMPAFVRCVTLTLTLTLTLNRAAV